MEKRRLGRTDLSVSLICLGTMTWGEQNSEAEGHAQMDRALAAGVDFFDTAEMYPVPPRAETYSRTESIIGTWFAARKNRDKVVLASKIAGPGRMEHVRGGTTRHDAKNIRLALEASLKRLQTDYIDLYQLHWPDRTTNTFGKLNYSHTEETGVVPLEETLSALAEHVKAGKIRHVGLSNETPWGTMDAVRAAERAGLPRVVSIQNPYSLLNRSFEIGLAEVSIREEVGLLAYSPLGMGTLAGKYLNGARPAGARLTLFDRFQRYSTERGKVAAEKYVTLARKHGLDPAQMALAFVNSRPFVTSNIIGATSIEQLDSNIASVGVTLSPEILAEIDAIHTEVPNPCP